MAGSAAADAAAAPRRDDDPVAGAASVPPEGHGGDAQQDTPETVRTYSAADVWREKDFAAYCADRDGARAGGARAPDMDVRACG